MPSSRAAWSTNPDGHAPRAHHLRRREPGLPLHGRAHHARGRVLAARGGADRQTARGGWAAGRLGPPSGATTRSSTSSWWMRMWTSTIARTWSGPSPPASRPTEIWCFSPTNLAAAWTLRPRSAGAEGAHGQDGAGRDGPAGRDAAGVPEGAVRAGGSGTVWSVGAGLPRPYNGLPTRMQHARIQRFLSPARSASTSAIISSVPSDNGGTLCSSRILRARSLALVNMSLRPVSTQRS